MKKILKNSKIKRKAKRMVSVAEKKYIWGTPDLRIKLKSAKDVLPKSLDEFDSLRSVIAYLIEFTYDDIGKLFNFLKVISSRDFVIDLDKVASSSGVKRSEELDFGYLRNFAVYKLIYEYTKNSYNDDNKSWNKVDTIKSCISWMDNMEYGADTEIYDKYGNLIISNVPQKIEKQAKAGVVFKKSSETKPEKEKKQKDALGLRLDGCSGDFDKLVLIAVEYGLSKEDCMKYYHFAESGRKGLLRMNIENRIRGIINKNSK